LPQPLSSIDLDLVVKMAVPDACRAPAGCSGLSRSSSMMAPHDFVDVGSGGEAEGDGAWRRPGLAVSPSLGRHCYNTSRLATMISVVPRPRRKTVSGTHAARWLPSTIPGSEPANRNPSNANRSSRQCSPSAVADRAPRAPAGKPADHAPIDRAVQAVDQRAGAFRGCSIKQIGPHGSCGMDPEYYHQKRRHQRPGHADAEIPKASRADRPSR